MTRPFAIIVVALTAVSWGVYLAAAGEELALRHLGPFSVAVGILAGAGYAYNHWLWFLPGVHLLAKSPRLTGTWAGTLRSDYVHEGEASPRPPIPAVLVVVQQANGLSARLFTEESSSVSLAASATEQPGERHFFATVYRNEPKLELQKERSPIHHGATRLDVVGPPRHPTGLVGNYWTDRNTTGALDFRFQSRKCAHSFSEGRAMVAPETEPATSSEGG